jgi:hypothetical protein
VPVDLPDLHCTGCTGAALSAVSTMQRSAGRLPQEMCQDPPAIQIVSPDGRRTRRRSRHTAAAGTAPGGRPPAAASCLQPPPSPPSGMHGSAAARGRRRCAAAPTPAVPPSGTLSPERSNTPMLCHGKCMMDGVWDCLQCCRQVRCSLSGVCGVMSCHCSFACTAEPAEA